MRKRPPRRRIKSRPLNGCPATVKSVWIRLSIQPREKSIATRINIASNNPVVRARCRRMAGSLSARIEMKMMLSIPRTISSAVSVSSAVQIAGSLNHSTPRPSPGNHTHRRRHTMSDPQTPCQPPRLGYVRILALIPHKPANLDPVALDQRGSEAIASGQSHLPVSRPKIRELNPAGARNRIQGDPAAIEKSVQVLHSDTAHHDDVHRGRSGPQVSANPGAVDARH